MVKPRVGCLLAVLLFSPALLSAQVSSVQRKERAIAADVEMGAEELVTLEKEAAHAMALNNSSFFQRIYSDEYVGTVSTGETLDRSALVALIQTSNTRYSSFIASDIHVRVYGPTAVVTCTWSTRGVQNGRNFSRQYRVIHVYLSNRAGGWKVIAGQETLMPG